MAQQQTHFRFQSLRTGLTGIVAGAAAFAAAVFGLIGTAQAGPETVTFKQNYPLGALVVVNSERRLYYVIGKDRALRYSVAIGRPGTQWTGQLFVASRAVNPSWTPPETPNRTVPGGPGNPLGVRALYLGWTNYRIHGTNAPGSIGSAASHGCFRMLNADVTNLYSRVNIGAPVYVVNTLPPVGAEITAELGSKLIGRVGKSKKVVQ
jgi:lipoprotein-anchoring transpeptidase ErfK/SrfK